MLSLLLFLLGAELAFSGLTYLFFWYEAVNTPHPAHASCRGGLRRCVLATALKSLASQTLVVATYPLGLIESLWRTTPSPNCPRPPVLLVHGLYHNPSAWLFYRWLLRRRGYANVFVWSYNTLKYDFQELAGQLNRHVREAADLCGGPVVLIGHSLGGLLARAAIADGETVRLVSAAVTLGSPHHGSKLAALAFGKTGRSLLPAGPLFERLSALPAPEGLPRLNLYSPVDNMVLPTASLDIGEPGWTQGLTAPLSHLGMLYHAPTARTVMDFLDENVPVSQEGNRGNAPGNSRA